MSLVTHTEYISVVPKATDYRVFRLRLRLRLRQINRVDVAAGDGLRHQLCFSRSATQPAPERIVLKNVDAKRMIKDKFFDLGDFPEPYLSARVVDDYNAIGVGYKTNCQKNPNALDKDDLALLKTYARFIFISSLLPHFQLLFTASLFVSGYCGSSITDPRRSAPPVWPFLVCSVNRDSRKGLAEKARLWLVTISEEATQHQAAMKSVSTTGGLKKPYHPALEQLLPISTATQVFLLSILLAFGQFLEPEEQDPPFVRVDISLSPRSSCAVIWGRPNPATGGRVLLRGRRP
ncbi:26S protease regulatory subunit 7 [Striga asiatica]|uniref:26S protease regulatory subunit 7 n=1 Tax=Striga asiatica TaxID=4170 RepID=A0A5A7PMG0_STRAF|nr:26S protease regulatory subunit 7 [Striga asiatica]